MALSKAHDLRLETPPFGSTVSLAWLLMDPFMGDKWKSTMICSFDRSLAARPKVDGLSMGNLLRLRPPC